MPGTPMPEILVTGGERLTLLDATVNGFVTLCQTTGDGSDEEATEE